MNKITSLCLVGVGLVMGASAGQAQSSPGDFRDEFLDHFERSSQKIVSLAEAMPERLYTWSPGNDVMSVAQVYMHIARYNFMYLEDNLGVAAPKDIDLSTIESITTKSRVIPLLRSSVDHVRQATKRMTSDDLTSTTRLYGRQVAEWAVLFQLLAHMNEHVGQSVAYARTNGIVPPWSS